MGKLSQCCIVRMTKMKVRAKSKKARARRRRRRSTATIRNKSASTYRTMGSRSETPTLPIMNSLLAPPLSLLLIVLIPYLLRSYMLFAWAGFEIDVLDKQENTYMNTLQQPATPQKG